MLGCHNLLERLRRKGKTNSRKGVKNGLVVLEGETPGEPFRILFPAAPFSLCAFAPLPILFTMKHMKVMKGTEEEIKIGMYVGG